MKIYTNTSVLEASKERIRKLFDEFNDVIVSFSGGKDSTTVLNLTLEIAEEKGRLPVKVLWIDQEAEWSKTVEYVDKVMRDPRVKPYWFQMPMVITNNASSFERYAYCWEEGKEWIHPKSDISIKENKYGTERFHELFPNIANVEFGENICFVGGVRTEEAPKRFIALTQDATYKDITWGKVLNKVKRQYTFYPIYDWSYTDVWKYIHDNNIEYNKVYDDFYKHGLNVQDMRVSNLHHETAIQSLKNAAEIDPEIWNKVVNRVDGANTIKQIKESAYKAPSNLPVVFDSWKEYAHYLIENLIYEDKYKEALIGMLKSKPYGEEFWTKNEIIAEAYYKTIINTILSSDWDFTKLINWTLSPVQMVYKYYHKGQYSKIRKEEAYKNKYLKDDDAIDKGLILKYGKDN